MDKGLEEDYQKVGAKGKIVLIEPGGGASQVDAARIAEENGAKAQIHINSGSPQAINIMQLRNTWGSPTPDTIDKIQQTPAISICNKDGKFLEGLIQKGPFLVNLKADAWRGYKKIRFPVGTLNGMKEIEKYVLCATHYFNWDISATDNAVGNSLMLEMAIIFAKHRKNLNRGIKFA